jgi:hypothetical protein
MNVILKQALIALLLCLPLLTTSQAQAVPPQTEQEITRLLDFIGTSGCEFERNGSSYTPAEARSHIELKYRNTRRYIDSSEDFIKYAATKSSFSGRAYKIRCGDTEQPTATWLLQALKRVRANEAPGS